MLDEESSGIVALGKSSAMIKNYRFNPSIRSGLYLVNCSCLVKIFSFVAYTVLYSKCKENPDEEN